MSLFFLGFFNERLYTPLDIRKIFKSPFSNVMVIHDKAFPDSAGTITIIFLSF